MDKGILYVAFGDDYTLLAEQTREIAKKFTSLPAHILTNVKGVKDSTYFDLPQASNRDIKTRMIEYTPFDTTLYLDVDTVFQHPFEMPEFEGLLVHQLDYWDHSVPKLYKQTMKKFGVLLPLSIYNGGMVGFKKTPKTYEFFKLWNRYWIETGRGREMPSLCCAIKKLGTKTTTIDLLFEPQYKKAKAVIQHDYGEDFFSVNKLTPPKTFKPFDTDPSDWNWEKM